MNDKNKEQQLFLGQNSAGDSQYLKDYVRAHPDNKMAWYLLGRDYAAKGQESKALYCFAQAGEIYEAFEAKKVAGVHYQANTSINQKVQPVKDKKKRSLLYKTAALVIPLILVLLLTSTEINDISDPSEYVTNQLETESNSPKTTTQDGNNPVSNKPNVKSLHYVSAVGPNSSWKAAILDLLPLVKPAKAKTAVVQGVATVDGKWTDWVKPPKPIATLDGTQEAGMASIDYLDAEACNCQPSDSGAVRTAAAAWQTEEEQSAVLRSSMRAYLSRVGKLPESANQLSSPYPNNYLPGITPYMQQAFAGELQRLSNEASKPTASGGTQAQTTPATTQAPNNNPYNEPLSPAFQILVDRESYRLALISGGIMVRSYPIGLGGSKTPDGEFVISEKVRNPNNRSNGEFGSRGMTLSDTLYAIHGTNQPNSIGKDQSLGCVRMLKEDLEELYDMVPIGTKVTIGKGNVGTTITKPAKPFALPLMTEDSNLKKIYRWLN